MRRYAGSLFLGAAAGISLVLGAWVLVGAAVSRQAAERLRQDLTRLSLDAENVTTPEARQKFVRSASRWLNARVTWIDEGGRVLADSDVAPARLPEVESHARRPEVLAARREGIGEARRVSVTVGEPFVYVARRLDSGGYLRIALSERELARVKEPFQRDFLLLGIVVGILAAGAVAAAKRRRDEDVARLSRAVEAVAHGRAAPAVALEADLEPIRRQLSDVAERAEAAERGGEGIRLLSRLVFEELPEALLVVDSGLRVLDANPAARRLFGVPEGRAHPALLDFVRSADVHAAFARALAGGPAKAAVTLLSESGTDRSLEVSVRPVPGGRGPGTPAAVGLLLDVTEREKTEAMRRRFIADVSHELRTPVATVRAAAETATAEPNLRPELDRLLSIVVRQTRHMEELVADLTELAQIETGAVTLVLEPLEVESLLAGVVEDLAAAVTRRRIDVKLEVPDGLRVLGDARRLSQVFRNLLDNAIKYSPEGGRVILSAEEGRHETRILVTDFGSGIPKDSRERIFHRFYRVDPSRSKSVPGTGLGLSIVKHLLILHGGSVSVDSEVGRGSTFTVRLPQPADGGA